MPSLIARASPGDADQHPQRRRRAPCRTTIGPSREPIRQPMPSGTTAAQSTGARNAKITAATVLATTEQHVLGGVRPGQRRVGGAQQQGQQQHPGRGAEVPAVDGDQQQRRALETTRGPPGAAPARRRRRAAAGAGSGWSARRSPSSQRHELLEALGRRGQQQRRADDAADAPRPAPAP